MAAASELRAREIVELRRIRVDDLNPILERETIDWWRRLDWDFRPSADLIRRFVGIHALSGYALVEGGSVTGYAYFICEETKGLVGDLYIVEERRKIENENRLLAAVLNNLMRTPHLARIESQLMLLQSVFSRPLPASEFLSIYRRNFMVIERNRIAELKPGMAAAKVSIDTWSMRRQEAAAHLIAAAYKSHVDSAINDQYRSVPGARRFLTNIVQYPGCGAFVQDASYVAFEPDMRRLCGVSLSSRVSSDVGHITQICVAPSVKGTGVGYELLRRSLQSLAESGCRKVSLTVTSSNTEAVRLYERMGFETALTFAALVWEGF